MKAWETQISYKLRNLPENTNIELTSMLVLSKNDAVNDCGIYESLCCDSIQNNENLLVFNGIFNVAGESYSMWAVI